VKKRTTEQIQILFEVSRDLLAVIGADGLVVAANPAWQRILGRDPESLVGTQLIDLVHPDDLARTQEAVALLGEGRSDMPPIENRYRHADGTWRWVRWSSVARRESGITYVAAHDVTAERQAVQEAREAIARMERSQRVAHVGSWERDLRTRRLTYSPEMYTILGLEPGREEPLGLRALLPRIVPQHHHRVHEAIEQLWSGSGVHELEYELLQPAGRVLWTVLELDRDAGGEPIRLRGTTQDVTVLRQNERRLEAAERVAGIGSFELRPSTGDVVWSSGTYRVYDRDPAEGPIDLETFWAVLGPEDGNPNLRRVVHESTDQHVTQWELEYPWRDRHGNERILSSRGETETHGDEEIVRGTVQDVTRDRRIRRQQQEIARLGQLALAGTDLRVLFDEVCRVTIELLGTDMVSILALQNDGSYARAASLGVPSVSGGTAIGAGRDSLVRHAVSADQPMLVADWHEEERFPYVGMIKEHGIRCTMVLPIRGRDAPWGALTTHSLQPGVEDQQANIAFLDALGSFLATAIESARHETEIAALATLRGRLVAENLEAEERVRQRISEQLHDGALQDLLAARQDLVEAATVDASDAMRAEMLGYAREGVERAVKLLREAVHALHPVVLQHGGLEAAMQAAADQAARQGGFRAAVTVDPAATGLRDELVMSLARELLNNAAKHAQAQTVRVHVGRDDGMVKLEVADDGVGLDPDAVASAPLNGHIGLASLAQRVEAVGGTFALGGGDGGGTTVVARLPIG
jgi:PAS domain S-box-containing protein